MNERDQLIEEPCTCLPVPEPNYEEGTMFERWYRLSQIEPPAVTEIDA
jgi:hypothetical protein